MIERRGFLGLLIGALAFPWWKPKPVNVSNLVWPALTTAEPTLAIIYDNGPAWRIFERVVAWDARTGLVIKDKWERVFPDGMSEELSLTYPGTQAPLEELEIGIDNDNKMHGLPEKSTCIWRRMYPPKPIEYVQHYWPPRVNGVVLEHPLNGA